MTAGTTAFHGFVTEQQRTRQRVRPAFQLKRASSVICTCDDWTAVQRAMSAGPILTNLTCATKPSLLYSARVNHATHTWLRSL
jgi:hypothetical protein